MAEKYNCRNCPGYCCSYPVIAVSKRDLERLAAHHGMSETAAEEQFCRSAHGCKRILKRKPDPHFRRICTFFDTEARSCTIYSARPAACRGFPGTSRCGYYDFLTFERRIQNDPTFIATTRHEED